LVDRNIWGTILISALKLSWNGTLLLELFVKTDAHREGFVVKLRQKFIVITSTVTNPVPLRVEGQSGHNHDVQGTGIDGRIRLGTGFENIMGSSNEGLGRTVIFETAPKVGRHVNGVDFKPTIFGIRGREANVRPIGQ
jgi:hypothetical protein